MLVSLVLEMRSRQEARVPLSTGSAVHALFLDLVRDAAPEMAAALHQDFEAKPFTASALMGAPERDGDRRLLRPNSPLWVRFTSLAEPLSGLLRDWAGRRWPPIRLLGADLEVIHATTDSRRNPWAGMLSFPALWERHFADPVPASAVDLEFFSPTTFKSGGLNVPLPLPRLLFHGWLEKWEQYGHVSLGEAAETALEEGVALAAYDAHSVMAHFGQARTVGFVGQARLQAVHGQDSALPRLLQMLSDFAFFAGTGQRTTMGLGMTRRLPAPVAREDRPRGS